MNHQITHLADRVFVQLFGAMDACGAAKSGESLESVLSQSSQDLEMDFSEVTFLDPSGVGLLVSLFKSCRTKGVSMSLIGLQGQPARLIQGFGLDKAFTVDFKETVSVARSFDVSLAQAAA